TGRGRGRARRSRGRRAPGTAQPRPRRARVLGRTPQRGGGWTRPRGRGFRPGAAPRPRQGWQGTHRPARGGSGPPSGSLPARGASGARARGGERTVPVGARAPPGYVDAAPRVRPPAPTTSCIRDASPRGRRRPADDPGPPRPQLPLDDAAVQPRGRPALAPRLRPLAPPLLSLRPGPRGPW